MVASRRLRVWTLLGVGAQSSASQTLRDLLDYISVMGVHRGKYSDTVNTQMWVGTQSSASQTLRDLLDHISVMGVYRGEYSATRIPMGLSAGQSVS